MVLTHGYLGIDNVTTYHDKQTIESCDQCYKTFYRYDDKLERFCC